MEEKTKESQKSRSVLHWAGRIVLLFVGMLIMTMGIALVTTADLGTTPISTVPLTFSAITGYSFGQMTFALNVCFVVFQVILLRRNFKPVNFLQIPVVGIFAAMIDMWMQFFSGIDVSQAWFAWTLSLSANFFLALGIYLQVRSKTLVQPGEGVVLAVAFVTKKAFSTLKIINDVTLVALAFVIAWISLGHSVGIGFGTLVSAVLVGLIIKAIDRFCRKVLKMESVG